MIEQMSIGRRLYPDAFGGSPWQGPTDYTPIIEHCGTVIERWDYDGYQGDTRVLLRNEGRFGFLEIGWGSCSGCDALQGCHGWAELDELTKEIAGSVTWFASKDEALLWFRERDWSGQYNLSPEFGAKCVAYLEAA